MSEAKFTKGPWRVSWGGRCRTLIANNGEEIMGNQQYYPWTPTSGHDWMLMAVAPEMCHELQRDIDRINEILLITTGLVNEPLIEERDRKVALLAKARGDHD